MNSLEVHKNNKIEHRQEQQQQQEFAHIGHGKKRKGLIMFAFNIDENKIYRVTLTKQTVFDTTKNTEVASYVAIVNPKHPHLYALNFKNAVRKFEKLTKAKYHEDRGN